jgi:SAM-dependent methyltransferase
MSESTPKKEFSVNDALKIILAANPESEVLVIGAGDTVIGGNTTYTDVAFGANVQCIADAHDLPFVDKSFDACIAVAVLEHVVDPYRCVQEMRRVLKPSGFVFAETPFMQPVHMGAHDFTRFTHLGHRRLFRYFDELRSGIAIGPGTSAGQILRYALAAMSDRPGTRRWLKLFGVLLTYPFRWLDYWTKSHRSAYDSASGFYFFGTLRQAPITDRELLRFFRGS